MEMLVVRMYDDPETQPAFSMILFEADDGKQRMLKALCNVDSPAVHARMRSDAHTDVSMGADGYDGKLNHSCAGS